MIKILITILLMLFFIESQAQTLTWSAPTEYENNTPIPATGSGSLGGFKIYRAREISLVPSATPLVINDKNATSYVFSNLEPGVHYFAMSAFTVENIESRLSETVFTTVASNTPSAPNGVTMETVVYNVIKRVNSFLLLPVGSINTNVPCDMTQNINGYNVVPREQVTWSGSIKPDVVVAKCAPQ